MQDWREHAQKNDLVLVETGPCQLCSADTKFGVSECLELLTIVTNQFGHQKAIESMTLFLGVDAHCLQHYKIHGRWNNYFHISRLHLILKKKVKWNYKYSSILSEVLDAYKSEHNDEGIIPSSASYTNKLNVKEISLIGSESIYVEKVYDWAHHVYANFESGHSIASVISDLFMARINNS